MSKNFRYSLLLILLLVVAIASLNWQIPSFSETATTQKQIVSLYIENVKSLSFDKKGKLNSSFVSPHITQYQHDKLLHVEQPKLTMAQSDNRWQLNAKQAVMDEKADVIELQGDINIQQKNGSSITTSYLLIDNQRKLAETDQAVVIKNTQGQTEANGLVADFTTKTLTLKNRVSTRYVPKAQP